MHILVVDDDASIRECLCEALRLEGHQTAACETVEAAELIVPYVDGVICDGLAGECWDLVIPCERRCMPLVVYTGDEEVLEKMDRIGVRCVRKPGSVEELLAALERQEAVR